MEIDCIHCVLLPCAIHFDAVNHPEMPMNFFVRKTIGKNPTEATTTEKAEKMKYTHKIQAKNEMPFRKSQEKKMCK